MLYPDGVVRAVHEIGGDGNAKRITLSGAGVVLEARHQGPGRVLQTLRDISLRVTEPPPRRFDLTLRTSERYDPQGQLTFRALHVTDPINRPGTSSFLPFGTQAERTSYEVSGLPRRRDYGVITQPGVSVDSTFVHDGLGRTRVITEGEGQDFVNVDYDWDGAGRLRLLELNGRQAGQIIDESTAITYEPGRRTDRRRVAGSLVSTTTWDFDGNGRLTESSDSQTGRRRTFAYDSADRLTQVDVFTPGLILTGQATSRFLYDALGRLVVRVAKDVPEFFLHDRTGLVEEFDDQQQPTRRYVYDERQQLVHYGVRDPDAVWRTYYPLLTADGAPWILVAARPEVSEIPTPPGATAAAVTRAAYYRENLPLIVEEYRWRPFEKGVIVRYDYASGTADGSPVDASLLPIDSGGRRLFADEGLLATGGRFHDPALRAFITLDSRGAWGHAMAFGNARSYAANNPIAFGDDGNAPFLVGVLVVVAVGALLGAGINAARQGVQILEGTRTSFSFSEVGFSALLGGALAPALVFAPELAVPLVAFGLGSSIYQFATGQIGGFTVAFDVATLGIPFGIAAAKGGLFGRGSVFGQARGLGPAASLGDRAGRFSQIGLGTLAQLERLRGTRGMRPLPTDPETPTTAEMLEALGGRELERPFPAADLEVIRGQRLGSGQQGEAFRVIGSRESLVVKVFRSLDGAAGEVEGLYQFHVALRAQQPSSPLASVRVVRVTSIGRTESGRSFIIKEFARGSIPRAMAALEGARQLALLEALRASFPVFANVPTLYLLDNAAMDASGTIIIFDPA
jgi:YD repeat-containing protein